MRARLLLVLCLLFVAACEKRRLPVHSEPVSEGADAGCSVVCGDTCCEAGERCDSTGVACEVVPDACVASCEGRTCGDDGCGGSCGACALGSLCEPASGTCYVNGTDSNPPPPAKCGAPKVLEFVGDEATGESDTRFASDELRTSCGNGAEEVFTFTLTEAHDVTVRARALTPGYAPALTVRLTCGGAGAAEELACAAARDGNTTGQTLKNVPAGTYTLVVESDDGSRGRASVLVQLGSPSLPESCLAVQPLVFVNGTATVTADTRSATDDARASCTDGAGPDLVYSFTLAEPRTVHIRVTGDALTGFRPSVYVRSMCSASPAMRERVCVNTPGMPYTIDLPNLPAGTWYVWVDGGYDSRAKLATAGQFTMTVTLPEATQPPKTVCDPVAPLTLANGLATVEGDTQGASSAGAPSLCLGGSRAIAYPLVLPANRDVDITLTPGAAPNSLPRVALKRGACDGTDPSDLLACSPGTGLAQSLHLKNLAGGTYYVFAEFPDEESYTFELKVVVSPPVAPANEDCSVAAPLVLVNGSAKAIGDLGAARSDTTLRCGIPKQGDAVYALTISQPETLTFTVRAVDGDFSPGLEVRGDCSSTRNADFKTCAYSTGSTVASSVLRSLPAGTWFVWVSGVGPQGPGRFELEVVASTPPLNEDCATAEHLTFTNGIASATGDTLSALDTAAAGCGTATPPGSSGGDVAYWFDLSIASWVTATVRADPSTPFSPRLVLRGTCDTPSSTSDLCSGQVAGSPGESAITNARLQPGRYFVWVDGSANEGGHFALSIQARPLPANDACGGATPLTFLNGVARVTGSTIDAGYDSTGSCMPGGSGRDLVYSFTTTEAQRVFLKVTPDPTRPSLPAVYLRQTCGSGTSEVACSARPDLTGSVAASAALIPAGTWYAWVDETAAAAGRFILEVTLSPPLPQPGYETCSTPEILSFVNDMARATADTSMAADEMRGSCGGAGGGDLVYAFTLTATSDVEVEMRALTGTLLPAVYVRRGPCSDGDALAEIGCGRPTNTSSFSGRVSLPRLPPGTYFAVADSVKAGGPFELQITRRPPATAVTNDGCAGAQTLLLRDGLETVHGTTRGLANDTLASCGGAAGGDAVYRFTLTSPQRVLAKVTPDPSFPAFAPVVSIRSGCTTAQDERACGALYGNNLAASAIADLEPGSYFVWVDGGGAPGDFTLDLAILAPALTSESGTCAAPTPLSFTNGKAHAAGTLSTGSNLFGSCAYLGSSRDQVFELTVAAAQQITVTPAAGSQAAVLLLRDACRSPLFADEVACAAGTYVAPPLTAPRVEPGTYYLWVAGTGQYDFTVELGPPASPPANDQCKSAEPLTVGATAKGTTRTAADDYGSLGFPSTCGGGLVPFDGRDVVYAVSTPVSGPLSITVTPTTATFNPVLWVSSSCGVPSACLASADAYGAGHAETLTFNAAAGATYYLVVDSYGSDAGDFQLTVR